MNYDFEIQHDTIYQPPFWWKDCKSQTITARKFLEENCGSIRSKYIYIPQPTRNFKARTPTEVLLLVVAFDDIDDIRETFEAWWNFITPPKGFSKKYPKIVDFIASQKKSKKSPSIRWVGFDPEAYSGLSANQALTQAAHDGVALSHYEILVAAAQFPNWVKSWGYKTANDQDRWHHPNMSAIKLRLDDYSIESPSIARWDNKCQLELTGRLKGMDALGASPTTRELY